MILFAYGNEAFKSELTLFRAHRVPAGEAERLEVADDARALFRVDLADAAPAYCTDSRDALAAYAGRGGWGITQLAIV